jgi:hypothetical protein
VIAGIIQSPILNRMGLFYCNLRICLKTSQLF